MITVNIDKAKVIAHGVRRACRAQEFQPLDEQIAKQIPGTDNAALEAKRQEIRDRHAQIQGEIEAATTAEAVKAAISTR
jgi:hypothetical protein